jgi:hypothetical protein
VLAVTIVTRAEVATLGTTWRLRPTTHLIAEFMVLALRSTLTELRLRHRRARPITIVARTEIAAFGPTLRLRPTTHLVAELMMLALRPTLGELLLRHGRALTVTIVARTEVTPLVFAGTLCAEALFDHLAAPLSHFSAETVRHRTMFVAAQVALAIGPITLQVRASLTIPALTLTWRLTFEATALGIGAIPALTITRRLAFGTTTFGIGAISALPITLRLTFGTTTFGIRAIFALTITRRLTFGTTALGIGTISGRMWRTLGLGGRRGWLFGFAFFLRADCARAEHGGHAEEQVDGGFFH